MSASAGCGTCAGLLFSLGSMNHGVDVHGDVDVHVLILRGREHVAVIGWRIRFASECVRGRITSDESRWGGCFIGFACYGERTCRWCCRRLGRCWCALLQWVGRRCVAWCGEEFEMIGR